MTTYIALLRGINVGGHNLVAMADLRAMLERMGFTEPRTLLQSGNIVFRSRLSSAAGIEQNLESETKQRLSVNTPFFVRTAEEWETIVARNPFKSAAKKDPARLVLVCFKEAPAPSAVKELLGAFEGPETFQADGRHAYITYPNGQGKSNLTMNLIEARLRTKGTARNWNTVLKLADLSSH